MNIPKQQTFTTTLNEFSELHKEIRHQHALHILETQEQYKTLLIQYNQHLQNLDAMPNALVYKEQIQSNIKQLKEAYLLFQNQIKITNEMLGTFSSHWGSYIEKIAVQYILQYLRANYGTQTFIQNFKQYWHKSSNVEIDLIAYNDDTAYIIEVKNQLKIEHLEQLEKIKTKLEENVLEFNYLKKQFILICLHCPIEIVALANPNIWIAQYNGKSKDKQELEWMLKN